MMTMVRRIVEVELQVVEEHLKLAEEDYEEALKGKDMDWLLTTRKIFDYTRGERNGLKRILKLIDRAEGQ